MLRKPLERERRSTRRGRNVCGTKMALCRGECVSEKTLSISSGVFLMSLFWYIHVVPDVWRFLVRNGFITSFLPFAAHPDQFSVEPYKEHMSKIDTTHLFALVGSISHMLPFVLGLSSMSLLEFARRDNKAGRGEATVQTSRKPSKSLTEMCIAGIILILPFTFFACTYWFLKLSFEYKLPVIYDIGHRFFVGREGGMFAYMASCSYTSMLLIGYIISITSTTSASRSSDRDQTRSRKDGILRQLPRVATFFLLTFVMLHFVGIPLWKEYTGPILRSHKNGFTQMLPMLASVTHSLAFIFGLSFMLYRRSHVRLSSYIFRSCLLFVVVVTAVVAAVTVYIFPSKAFPVEDSWENIAATAATVLCIVALPATLRRCCWGPKPGRGTLTRDRVWTMPRLKSEGRYDAKGKSRARIDKIRQGCRNFPPPYPNGWYRCINSADLPVGAVKPVALCGREMVVFRTTSGEVGVLDAFCPHLGTHLGHGGTVTRETVVCPYHKWSFDVNGQCRDIPYCPRASRVVGKDKSRANTRAYRVRESCGMIFVWFHIEDEEPFYPLHLLKEIEDSANEFYEVGVVNYTPFLMHVMEPSQNSADYYHFRTVHSWLPVTLCGVKLLKADHAVEAHYGGGVTNSPEGRTIGRDHLLIRERIENLWLFGRIRLPSFFPNMMTTEVHLNGSPLIMFKVENPVLGSLRALMTLTPDGPFRQRMQLRGWANGLWPRPLARFMMHLIMQTVEQDRQVWEHKIHIAPRNLVAGDGPFAGYGRWIEYFYSKKSWETSAEMSSDW